MGEISEAAKSILTQAGLTDNIAMLLELYGIRTLNDLTTLDYTIIEDVENSVKNGTFEAIVDLEDKNTRLKFLGYDYKSLNLFKFQPMDTRKLLKVSALAQEALNKLEEDKKESQVVATTAVSSETPSPSINVNVTVVKAETIEKEIPQLAAESTMRKVHRVFESLNMTDVDLTNFNIEYVKSDKNPILNIACPICKQPLSLQNCGSDHIFSIFNLKRHVKTKHLNLKPPSTSESRVKSKKKLKLNNISKPKEEDQTVADLSEFLQVKIKKEVFDPNEFDYYNPTHHDEMMVNYKDIKVEHNVGEDEEEEEDMLEKKVKKKRIRIRKKKTGDGKDKKDPDEGLIFRFIDGVKIYECGVCGKSNILRREHLRNHMVTHSTERNQICDLCSCGFKTRSALRSHIIQVHSENFHYCDICGMKGKTKSQMRVHMDAVHLAKRNRICHICGKSFKTSSSLATHMRNHSELKPEVCEVCGFSAINKGKMRRHMKSHTKERNYQCGICGKMFLYSYNVTAHIKHVHNREKRVTPSEERLTCFLCNLKFPTVTKTNEHMKTMHGYEYASI